MSDLKRVLKELLNSPLFYQEPPLALMEYKGKLSPLQIKQFRIEVKKIYTIPAIKKELPLIFFDVRSKKKKNFDKEKIFVGISLAQNTSDLQLLLAKRILNEKYRDLQSFNRFFSRGKGFLMSYKYQTKTQNLPLILINKNNLIIDNLIENIKLLIKIQKDFRKILEEIVKNNISN